MDLTREVMEDLESDIRLKATYLRAGTWGKNRLVFLPALVTLLGLGWAVYSLSHFFTGEAALEWALGLAGGLGVALVGFLVNRMLQKAIDKGNEKYVQDLPVCLARIVVGNEEYHLFHAFFTTGEKRHDAVWMEALAHKIWDVIDYEKEQEEQNEISRIFSEKLLAEEYNEARQLPPEFTDGEPVYQILRIFKKDAIEKIDDRGGYFPVMFRDVLSVITIEEKDI